MGILNKISKKDTKTSEASKVSSRKKVDQNVSVSDMQSTKSEFASRILIRPMLSEKTTHAEANKKYSFFVAKDATKIDVKRAIKEVYGILPLKVNMVVGEGKVRRFGKVTGRKKDYKKAVVTIAKDKQLSIHEGV